MHIKRNAIQIRKTLTCSFRCGRNCNALCRIGAKQLDKDNFKHQSGKGNYIYQNIGSKHSQTTFVISSHSYSSSIPSSSSSKWSSSPKPKPTPNQNQNPNQHQPKIKTKTNTKTKTETNQHQNQHQTKQKKTEPGRCLFFLVLEHRLNCDPALWRKGTGRDT